ncbi:MAG: 50S ribosomal protein L25 [Prevotellaceae bacterium]|jgi:large subunit ribosomal protein L25|nr:50S ribosomal protein L25 [Prevotellaceae bacterium]
MKTFKVSGSPRTDFGKKAATALRAEGLIPAILYGGEAMALPYDSSLNEGRKIVETQGKAVVVTDFAVTFDAIRKLIYTSEIFLVELTIAGRTSQAIVKDIQFHPVSEKILHIDFLEVFETKPIVIDVPVVLEGHSIGVRAGGKLNLILRKLRVKGLAKHIPEVLHINTENLELGKSIQVKSLQFDNLQLLNAPASIVCVVKATRGSKTAEPAK